MHKSMHLCLSVYLSPTLSCSQSPEHHEEAIEQLLRGFRRSGSVGTDSCGLFPETATMTYIHQALFHRDMGTNPFAQIGRQRHKPFGKVFKVAAIHWPGGFL